MALNHDLNHIARTLQKHNASCRALENVAGIVGMKPEMLVDGTEDQIVRRLRGVSLQKLGRLAAALAGVTGGSRGSLDAIAEQVVAHPSDGSKLEEIERAVITHAVAVSDGNVSAAARLLGVDRKMLDRRWRKIQREG
jgi:DNA-binding NtrC family response regulator